MQPIRRLYSYSIVALSFFALICCPKVQAQAHRKADAKSWKLNREAGQKAYEAKDYAQAEQYFTAALDDARNFDAMDYRLAESLTDLGQVYAVRGKYEAAEPLCKQAVDIRHGDPNPGEEILALYLLGRIAERLEHYDEAIKAYQRMAEVFSHKLGANHPDTVIASFHVGMVYFKEQDYEKAEPILRHCLEQFKHPLSKIVVRQGDPAAHGLEVFRRVYRPNYAYAMEADSRLTQIYLQQNKLPEAEKCMKEALDLVDEYAKKGDPAIPEALQSMAAFYYEMSNFKAAEPVLERLIQVQEKNSSENSEAVLSSKDKLAGIYMQEKKYTEAEPLYQKILAAREASAPDSRETAVSLANLGKIYVEEGDYAKAEPLYRRQLELTEKTQGDGVALTPILVDQETIYTKLGKDAELEGVYKREIAVFEKMFGTNNAVLVKPLSNCAEVLRREKHDAEAEQMEARANALKQH